jgi:hypothetical protein
MAAANFTLVYSSPNRLLYQVATDGTNTAGTLTTSGAASPDVLTDAQKNSGQGPISRCALAYANGFGAIPAGALSQTQARAIWLSIDVAQFASAPLGAARCRIFNQTGAACQWAVDANVDGSGHATIVCTPAGSTAAVALLEIEVPGVIGE